MQLSELLGLAVHDGAHRVGTVIDVRLSLGTHSPDERPTSPRVLGLLISPRSRSSYLGYERSDADRPRLLASLLRWRHRGTFLAGWDDIAIMDTSTVQLRTGYTRYAPVLPTGSQ
jgi:hypothetical protein